VLAAVKKKGFDLMMNDDTELSNGFVTSESTGAVLKLRR
jgi:hypothetical protein